MVYVNRKMGKREGLAIRELSSKIVAQKGNEGRDSTPA